VDQALDLAGQLGTDKAWVGFTGSTGDATSEQDITSWKLVAASM
jgi:hypothetical protein